MMWKILTGQNREIYYSLINRRIFPEEQKRCNKRTRGTGELLYIDQHILNESKTRRKNLVMAWIYYRCTWTKSNCLPKNERIGNSNRNCENIQPRYKNGIWHRKMHHASHEKRQTTHDGRSRTTKSNNNQNARRKGNLQILRDIGS